MLVKQLKSLITRDKLRETLKTDSWCNKQKFQPALEDNDGVSTYSIAYEINKSEIPLLENDLENLYVKPARISIVREFVKSGKNIQLGEPFSVSRAYEDKIVVVLYFPVMEME
jgi:hypothetical protein